MRKTCKGCFENYDDSNESCPYCGYNGKGSDKACLHIEVGTVLNKRYLVGNVIGNGGFGITYCCFDRILGTKVAIKEFFPIEMATRERGQTRVTVLSEEKTKAFTNGCMRFKKEGETLSEIINHPGIVKIIELFEENDTNYMVMEYLEGETLAQRLVREKTIPEDEAVEIIIQVLDALEHIHTQNILHRDVAPDNIFLQKDGKVKLIDFGASRHELASVTKSVNAIFKSGYTPSEQYSIPSVQGPYSDVYSAAATLYRMLTGEVPDDALTRKADYARLGNDPLKDPNELADVSMITTNALLNAMIINPDERTQSASKFKSDLQAPKAVKRIIGKRKAGASNPLYKWPLWLKITLSSLIAIALIAWVLIGTGIIRINNSFTSKNSVPEGKVAVPDLYDMEFEDAIKALEDLGLTYTTNSVNTSYVAVNHVLNQDPASGHYIDIGGTVVITISRGDGTIDAASDGNGIVPPFLCIPYNEVLLSFTQAGFTTEMRYGTSNVSEGQVYEVTLPNGTPVNVGDEYPSGTSFIIYVSGTANTNSGSTMPNVVGMTESSAKSTLVGLGLNVTVVYGPSNTVNPGQVFAQSITSGSPVTAGMNVTISVAQEIETLVTVPNVVGTRESNARSILTSSNLQVEVQYEPSSSVFEGVVIRQTPGANTTVNPGSTVTIYVSSGNSTNSTTSRETVQLTIYSDNYLGVDGNGFEYTCVLYNGATSPYDYSEYSYVVIVIEVEEGWSNFQTSIPGVRSGNRITIIDRSGRVFAEGLRIDFDSSYGYTESEITHLVSFEGHFD